MIVLFYHLYLLRKEPLDVPQEALLCRVDSLAWRIVPTVIHIIPSIVSLFLTLSVANVIPNRVQKQIILSIATFSSGNITAVSATYGWRMTKIRTIVRTVVSAELVVRKTSNIVTIVVCV